MDKFESSIREIPYPQHSVYSMLSDLENIERVRDRIPADKAGSLSFDTDTVSITGTPVGNISMRIVDREPEKCVKMESAESPLPFTFWIQVLPLTPYSCKMKLTLGAEINFFIRQMAGKQIQETVEKIADALQSIRYEE